MAAPKAEPAAAESRVLAAGGAVAATLASPEGAPQGHHGRLQHRCGVDAMALPVDVLRSFKVGNYCMHMRIVGMGS